MGPEFPNGPLAFWSDVTSIIEPADPQGADALGLLREPRLTPGRFIRTVRPGLAVADEPSIFATRIYVVVYLANRPVGSGALP